MFFTIPSQPMSRVEEQHILLSHHNSPSRLVDLLLDFAEKYRGSMVEESGAVRKRKLGTRTLVRVMRRIAVEKGEVDLYAIITRILLAEFLPAVEKMNLEGLLSEVGIEKKTPPVCILVLTGQEINNFR
jgi:hypothetical protein